MKNLIVTSFCFLLLGSMFAQAPVFQWAKAMGGTGNDWGYSVATDAAGNVYTTGDFSGTADFDPSAATFTLSCAPGDTDIFISKLNSAGGFVWAIRMGGATVDEGCSIAVDGSGNILTTGRFAGTADFDPGAAVYNLTTPGQAIFISKLDPAGNFLWAKSLGGTVASSSGNGYSIAADAAGNVYTTGYFAGASMDFDPGAATFTLTPSGLSTDIFISKLDASGNFVWAKAIGGANGEFGNSIKIDPSGNVLTTGYFMSTTVDFDPGIGVFNLTLTGLENMFISKLDAAGNFLWAKKIGGGSNIQGLSVTTDNAGYIITTGMFNGTTDFDPGAASYTLTTNGSQDIFISKLNSAGNFVWAQKMGGTGPDQGNSVTTDALGNVYSTGYYYGTADFDPGVGISNLTGTSPSEVFISKLDSSGNFVWVKGLGGNGNDVGYSVSVDASNNVYVAGGFIGNVNFNLCGSPINLTSAGSGVYDVFVHKLNQVPYISGNTTLCAGSSSSLTGAGGSAFSWSCPGGTPATSTSQSPVILYNTPGTYTVSLTVTNSCGTTSVTATINVNSSPVVTASGSATICSGNSTPLNAAGANTYVWSPATGLSCVSCISPTASPTNTMTYSVTGTNAGGCSNTNSVTVTVNPSPVVTISGNYNTCIGTVATLTASGASTYMWNTGATTAVVTLIGAGTYSATGTNAQGCTATRTVTVTMNALPTVSINASSTSICSGNSSTLTASGAATYSWNTGETTISISVSPTSSVTYTVTGTNAAGCSTTKTIIVAGHLPIPITVTATPTSCGLYTGTVAVSVSGPGAVPPFSYLWSCGTTSSAISGLDAGIYRANVIDGIGCFSFADALVTSSNGPTLLTNSVTAVSCFGMANGAVDINVTGGAQPYTFFWSDGTTTEDISNVSFGPYEVVVTDAGGCSATKSVFVGEPTLLTLSSTSTNASCATANGTASVIVNGGNVPYNYLWSSGGITSSVSGLTAGVYTVSVTDSKGCFDSLLVGVQNSGGPLVAVDTVSAADCGSNGFVLIIPQDSGKIASYVWTTGSTTQNLNNAVIGNYGLVITDTSGCKSTLVVPVTPVLPPIKPICLVTVDTASGMNIVVWEKPVSTFIAGFNIYRESSQQGIYQKIYYSPYAALSTYSDVVSDPASKWAKYRISMKDICGKEGPLSHEHKTIHLSIQSTTPDSTTLVWDDYVGYPFSYYHIFRKDSAFAPWYLLDSVPAAQTFYVDTAVPHTSDTTTVFYHVDVSHYGGDCIATIVKGPDPMTATVKSSKSNSSDRTSDPALAVAEISDTKWMSVYPNPSSGTFSVASSKYSITSIGIYNLLGENIYSKNVSTKKAEVSVPGIAAGIYQLRIVTAAGIVNRKIVVAK